MISLHSLMGACADDGRFFREHWDPRIPTVARNRAAHLEALFSDDRLTDPRAMLDRVGTAHLTRREGGQWVGAERDTVLAHHAAGQTLQFSHAEIGIGDLRRALAPLLEDLGMAPEGLALELFFGKGEGLTDVHYDHEHNFHIVLRGDKRWRLWHNRHVENPTLPNPQPEEPSEELFSAGPMPTTLGEPDFEFEVSAGDVLYLPRGVWHEVQHHNDSAALNLVFFPPLWYEAIGHAIAMRLRNHPAARAYAFGALAGSRLHDDATAHLADLKSHARAAIEALDLEEIALSEARFRGRWSPSAAGRRLERREEALYLVLPEQGALEIEPELEAWLQRVIDTRGWFELHHGLAQLSAGGVYSVMEDLAELGLMELHRERRTTGWEPI